MIRYSVPSLPRPSSSTSPRRSGERVVLAHTSGSEIQCVILCVSYDLRLVPQFLSPKFVPYIVMVMEGNKPKLKAFLLPAAPAYELIRRGCSPANLPNARYAMAARRAQPAARGACSLPLRAEKPATARYRSDFPMAPRAMQLRIVVVLDAPHPPTTNTRAGFARHSPRLGMLGLHRIVIYFCFMTLLKKYYKSNLILLCYFYKLL
eukprot:SAG11_NODE_552_length_8583_cov_3.699081_4_plen_206_part_00